MNYTLSLVVHVAVPKGYGGHTLPSSGAAACDGQLDYMCRNIVNRDLYLRYFYTKLICTIHG